MHYTETAGDCDPLQVIKIERMVLKTARRLGLDGDALADVRPVGTMNEQRELLRLFLSLPEAARKEKKLSWRMCRAIIQSSGCKVEKEEENTFVSSVSSTPERIEKKLQRERGAA